MRYFIKLYLLGVIFFAFISNDVVYAKKVMLLVGGTKLETEKIPATALIRDAIIQVMGEANIELNIQYADISESYDDALNVKRGLETISVVRQYQPDVLITQYSTALQYVGIKIDDIPVVFVWILVDPKTYGLPKPNITGVLRRSYAADTWALTRELLGIKRIALLGKGTPSMEVRRNAMIDSRAALEKKSGVQFVDMYLVNTIDEWKKSVSNWKEDVIHLADTSRILDGERMMSSTEVTKWTLENTKVPVVASIESDVKDGALLSIISSEQHGGILAASMALEILNGKPVSSIPMQDENKGKLVINVKTAQKLGIEIPYEILESAGKIYE